MPLDTPEDLLSELLTGAVAALDIPDELYAVAERRYKDVGAWLAAEEGDETRWDMYRRARFSSAPSCARSGTTPSTT